MANSRVRNIDAVIVCIDYVDFLAETLPHNLNYFDRVLVATSHEDVETQDFCKRHSVNYIVTDVHNHDAGKFNKGRVIDAALGQLGASDWVVHMDADVYLPPRSRQQIENAMPDQECIYGIDRVNCNSYQEWQKYINQPASNLHRKHHHCVMFMPGQFTLGARIILDDHCGYVPIGFFQMWHTKHNRRYPAQQGSAEHTDVLHSLQWPSNNRRLMPEIIAIHLDSSTKDGMGENWSGRKSPQFGDVDPFGTRKQQAAVAARAAKAPSYGVK